MDAENERLTREPKLKDFLALKSVDLKIKQGEFVCIIGDVGSGKSSLLNSIIGDLMYCNPLFMIAHGESELNEDLK
jgi:ABC-type lipoprotein export system ATPase subunit